MPQRARRGLCLTVARICLGASCVVACGSPPVPPSIVVGTPAPQLADAIEFRQMVGLRFDMAWIERVAADPTARRDAYPVPLLPEEVAELESRPREGEQLSLLTERY